MKKRTLFKGQTLVEFALILPIALLLLIGFFDLGRVVFYYSSLTNAVREATRAVIVQDIHGNIEAVKSAIELELEAYAFAIDPEEIIIEKISYFTDADDMTTSTSGSTTGKMTNILIDAKYSFEPVTPFIARLLSDGKITLRTHSAMRISSPFRPTFK